MNKLNQITLAISMMLYIQLQAQDIHLSQFYHSPLNLNPALTGDFLGDIRVTVNHRNQWASVSVPYLTSSISVDSRINTKLLKNDGVGIGLLMVHDKSGDGELTSLQMMATLSYFKWLDANKNHNLSIGFQAGIFQKHLDNEKLIFGNQFQDIDFNMSVDPKENFLDYNVIKADLQAGLVYQFVQPGIKRITTGISLFHVTRPEQSFLLDKDRLSMRSVLHGEALFKVSKRTMAGPSLLLMHQVAAREITVGGRLEHSLESDAAENVKLLFATHTRISGTDAIILMAGLGYKVWDFGFSYDINVSSLTLASSYQGGFELAIIYRENIVTGKRKLPTVLPCIRLE